MTETTTIEITLNQREELERRKASASESYKDVLQRLIDGHSIGVDETRVREIAREEISDRVVVEAQE